MKTSTEFSMKSTWGITQFHMQSYNKPFSVDLQHGAKMSFSETVKLSKISLEIICSAYSRWMKWAETYTSPEFFS